MNVYNNGLRQDFWRDTIGLPVKKSFYVSFIA